MKLLDIAHGRSGDKGNRANIGVVARNGGDFGFLRAFLTEEYVADLFSEELERPGTEHVTRYELPEIEALNFMLEDALDGGASGSLRTDRQGKTYAAVLLRQDVGGAYDRFQD